VNLFLANTTLGSTTGKDGKYLIRNIPPGIYELIVSHISYELKNVQINLINPDSLIRIFSLDLRTITGEEVSVTATIPRDWKKDLKKFTDLFNGKTINSLNCRIINPEVINFETTKAGYFIASTDSVIRVENRSLGYQIDIILKSFQYQEDTKDLEFIVYPKFEALNLQHENELKYWYENRSITYYGSFKHFMKSLSQETLDDERFILSYSSRPGKLGTSPIDLSTEKFLTPYANGMKRFFFEGILNVYHKKTGNSWIKIDAPLTFVDLWGNHKPQDGIIKWGGWAKERIADLLPLDYDPNNFVFTPAIDLYKEKITSESKNEIEGILIVDVLDELVFKDSDHSDLIEQLYKDIVEIITDEETAEWKTLETNKKKADFLRRFWLLRDMSYGTKENERLEEHYERLQFAQEIYSALTPSGYDDRGKIFVKYGQPDAKTSDVNPGFGKTCETWMYQINGEQITFDFIDKIYGYQLTYRIDESIVVATDSLARLTAMARLFERRQDLSLRYFNLYNLCANVLFESVSGDALRELYINIDRQLNEHLSKQVVEHANLPTSYSNQFEDVSELKFSMKPAIFKNTTLENTLALAYGFRQDDINFSKSDTENQQEINIQTVIRDPDINDITIKDNSIPINSNIFDEKKEFIHQINFPIVDNIFYILADISNPSGKQKGFQDYSIRNPRYTDQQLNLSSVVFAKEIKPVIQLDELEKSSQLIRNDLAITMYPFSEINRSEPIHLYLEIYGLEIDGSGKTEYDIEYTVLGVEKKGIKNFINKLNPFKKDRSEISISYTQEGKEINDYFSIRLDFSQLDPRTYDMSVLVTDKISNESKEAKTSFILK